MDSFLKRWARLKQQKNQTPSEPTSNTSLPSQSLSPPPLQPSALEERDHPQIVPIPSSPEGLFTIDSSQKREDPFYSDKINALKADRDFSVFLQEGIPDNIQKEALSLAWRTEDSIANFETLAEYDWNFNTPDYAKLQPTDDIKSLLADILSPPAPAPSSEEGLDTPGEGIAIPSSENTSSISPLPFSELEGEREEKPDIPSDKNLNNQSVP
ncbi:DUF3306 domain-containing protein [Entomobacter blattae]|uniref:DUF3306 domain-containing protein n=1 Tax=Entomobacter blattae TaxID=2762277 RepID=A0A7H1NT22_9PROT|nr:DUF3306 domain-containing protein [Entomobacter blattae]QNT78932.1 hypothetical protein JGUZn3_17140 [Entomobacter blattae]